MKVLFGALYSIVAWFAVGTIGFGSWLGWALLIVAADLSIGTVWRAITND